MRIRRSVNSVELLRVGVEAAKTQTTGDITTFLVEVAVLVEGTRPVNTDYKVGAWETINGRSYATVMVGPGADIELTLTDEVYIAWVRITTDSETPEIKSEDVIEVY